MCVQMVSLGKINLVLADACHSGWSDMWLLHARDGLFLVRHLRNCTFVLRLPELQHNDQNARQKCLSSASCQVTGGSAGIGRAAALAFGQNGARVAIMGRRKERLDTVLADLPRWVPLSQRGISGTLWNVCHHRAPSLCASVAHEGRRAV